MCGAIAGSMASARAGGAMSKLFGGGHKAASGGIEGDVLSSVFFFQAEDGIRDLTVTGVQTCALPISLRSVTHCPIQFVGVGEKLTDFEVFHPDRMASRILGMGDVLTLIEKAQEHVDADRKSVV